MNKLLKQSLLLTPGILFFSYSINRQRTKLYLQEQHHFENHIKPKSPTKTLEDIYNKHIHSSGEVIKHGIFYKKPLSKEDPDEELFRVIARNEKDYDTHKDLYEEVITYYNLQSSSSEEERLKGLLYEKDDVSFVKTIISNMSEVLDMTVEECNVELTRNIKSYDFSTLISRQGRKELTERIVDSIRKCERVVFENKLSVDSEEYKEEDEVEYKKGGFYMINKRYKGYSKSFPLQTQYGVYNDWPEDRIVYKNNGISIIINHLDHLKYSFNYEKKGKEDQNKQILSKDLYSFYDLVDLIGKTLPYAYNEKFGFLSAFPTKSGNGLNFRLRLKVSSKLNKQQVIDAFSSLSRQFNGNYLVEEEVSNGESDFSLIISSSSTNVSFIQVLFEVLGQKSHFF